jgi:hypothetical protein
MIYQSQVNRRPKWETKTFQEPNKTEVRSKTVTQTVTQETFYLGCSTGSKWLNQRRRTRGDARYVSSKVQRLIKITRFRSSLSVP